jgi:hypothetical protein
MGKNQQKKEFEESKELQELKEKSGIVPISAKERTRQNSRKGTQRTQRQSLTAGEHRFTQITRRSAGGERSSRRDGPTLCAVFRQESREMSQNRDERRYQKQCHDRPGSWSREIQAVSKTESFLDDDG